MNTAQDSVDRKTVNVQEASAGEQGVKVSLLLCVHITLHKEKKRERKILRKNYCIINYYQSQKPIVCMLYKLWLKRCCMFILHNTKPHTHSKLLILHNNYCYV